MRIWSVIVEYVRSWWTSVQIQATAPYVGIATILGGPGVSVPVYRKAQAKGRPIGYLTGGQYVPHLTATASHSWLFVTLRSGDQGWLQNDPARVSVTEPNPSEVRVVVDPGHGGSDSGATGNGLIEKMINFSIAYDHLGPRLLGDSRIDRVWFTRTGDDSVSLGYRANLATASAAQLFLSVHNNSYTVDSHGTETYFKCGTETTPDVVAASRRAACLAHLRLKEQIDLWASPSCPWSDRGVICRLISRSDQRSYYYVLRNTAIPAILVECMFVSNPGEAGCLANDEFRDRLGQALYDGITDALFGTAAGDNCKFLTYYGL